MTEQWKIIPSLPRYEASSLGRVRNRWTRDVLAVCKDPYGNLTVNTYHDGCQASRRVARLVGEVFCRGFKRHLRPIYLDGDRSNCRPENLRWVCQSQVTGKPYSKNKKQTINTP